MRDDPLYTSWTVRCESEEQARQLRAWLAERITPDATFVNVVRAFPGGTETKSDERHRLGDYFEDVRLLPGLPEDLSAFRILFHRRPTAGRFWKDLMVKLLQAARGASPNATTTLDYRGDQELVETTP
jgi:hypothetical protein